MDFDGLGFLFTVVAALVFFWVVAFLVAVDRNRRPVVTHWPDGSRSFPLVDFGPLVFSGTILFGALALLMVYAGLTIN